MTTVTRYASVEELKERIDIDSTTDDQILGRVLDAVSRLIEKPHYANQRFYTTAADETRYFTALTADYCPIPIGLVSVTTLAIDNDDDRTYGETWATSDFEYEPVNASTDNEPYGGIRIHPTGNYTFPLGINQVKVIGKFGWPALPDEIREATLLQATRLFRRKEAPFGVVGSGDFGQAIMVKTLDPDVVDLIKGRVKRLGFG